ncbi:olfactory receptor 52Z1-like [Polyodon spathula]|uniref:olfactory receptor 52Z1-like n=1 Tax=Polyodon spathula TaxID=7913 RepID=UPI001B7E8ECD|nr:olfactory receptor 52Z1-like [Polyodon spathula]
MEDQSINVTSTLTLDGFKLIPEGRYPAFVLGLLLYCIIVFCNLLILIAIALERRLHEPMYVLLFNLPVNDLMGVTAVLPKLLTDTLTDSETITYSACVMQAFFVHFYAGGSMLILTAMAYDRYVAICCPLRYNAILTSGNLIKIIIVVWVLDFILIGVLIVLVLRLQRCRSRIQNAYCDNPSLMRLICADTSINNIYGLFITAFLQGLSLLAMIFTYFQILLTCLMNKQPDAKSKATQTCATHLVVYIVLCTSALFVILSYRFEQISPYFRKVVGVAVVIYPAVFNPIIYGLKTKEIRNTIIKMLRKKTSPF